MFGASTIRNISDVAAYRAAEEGKKPLVVWKEEDFGHTPFLGDYTPAGWRRATWAEVGIKPRNVWFDRPEEEATFMVDASGFGSTSEPALTFGEAYQFSRDAYLAAGEQHTIGFAIREAGQFQVVMGVYIKDASSIGNPAPDEDDVICEECGTVHSDLEECDPDGYEDRHPVSRCPACGDVIDYCQGHGEIGDPVGRAVLDAHDDGDHTNCHPDGCEETNL